MQRKIAVGLLVVSASLVLAVAAPRLAGAWEAPYIDQGIRAAVKAAENEQREKGQSGYGCRSNGICMLGAFIDRGGKPLVWNFGLKDKKKYIFVAAGDSDVTAIRLSATNKDEKKPFATDDAAAPVLYVEMDGDGVVSIAAKNTEAKEARNFVCIICLENDGVEGPLKALKNCAVALNDAVAKAPDSAKLQMDQDYDDICICAQAFTSDTSDATFNRTFRADVRYTLVGIADDNCKDLGCSAYVRDEDGKDAKKLASDNDPNAAETPWCAMAFKAHDDDFKGNVHLHLNKFADDSKPSFAVLAICVRKE